MEDDMHEVVQLLLARMESHPDEFGDSSPKRPIDATPHDRWWKAMSLVNEYGAEEEKAALRAQMRKIKLDSAHGWMMDELLNGDERRRQEIDRAERDRALYTQQAYAQQGKLAHAQLLQNYNRLGIEQATGTASSIGGNTITSTATPALSSRYISNLKELLGL